MKPHVEVSLRKVSVLKSISFTWTFNQLITYNCYGLEADFFLYLYRMNLIQQM